MGTANTLEGIPERFVVKNGVPYFAVCSDNLLVGELVQFRVSLERKQPAGLVEDLHRAFWAGAEVGDARRDGKHSIAMHLMQFL